MKKPPSPRLIPYSPVNTPWFIDPAHRNVFSGHRYAFRCVCAISSVDSDKTLFAETSNPKQLLWKIQRDRDYTLIVQQAFWSRGRASKAHLQGVHDLLAKAGQTGEDGWFIVPKTHITPLLVHAARNVKIQAAPHSEFAAWVRAIETDKIRADLASAGLDPAIVAATVVV